MLPAPAAMLRTRITGGTERKFSFYFVSFDLPYDKELGESTTATIEN